MLHLNHFLDFRDDFGDVDLMLCLYSSSSHFPGIQSSYFSNTGRKHKFTFNVLHTQYYQCFCYNYFDHRNFRLLTFMDLLSYFEMEFDYDGY